MRENARNQIVEFAVESNSEKVLLNMLSCSAYGAGADGRLHQLLLAVHHVDPHTGVAHASSGHSRHAVRALPIPQGLLATGGLQTAGPHEKDGQ